MRTAYVPSIHVRRSTYVRTLHTVESTWPLVLGASRRSRRIDQKQTRCVPIRRKKEDPDLTTRGTVGRLLVSDDGRDTQLGVGGSVASHSAFDRRVCPQATSAQSVRRPSSRLGRRGFAVGEWPARPRVRAGDVRTHGRVRPRADQASPRACRTMRSGSAACVRTYVPMSD